MRLIIVFLFCVLAQVSMSQRYPFYRNYEWEEQPVLQELNTTNELYYYNKYSLGIEYEFVPFYGYIKYYTEHYRVKLNSDIAIEEFNKVYISMEDVHRVIRTQARVIKPNAVVDVDVEMEEYYNEDEQEHFRYFPISDLELGDEVEVLFVLQMESALNGDQFYFQGEIPIYNFDFRFIAPIDADFNFLAHNGLPTPQLQDTIIQRHEYRIQLDSIPGLRDEYFSEFNNASKKLDVSLKGINNGYDENYSPYQSFSDYANETFNQPLGKKDLKAIHQLNLDLGVSKFKPEIENIRIIENYMKNEFLIGYANEKLSIEEMIELGKGDGSGSLHLFLELLYDANIRYEYGLISDRYDSYFSSEIESDYFLQHYFLYFPDSKTYLAPLDFASRVGYLNSNWTPNNGLFLTNEKSFGKRSILHQVKTVAATSSKDNKDSTVIVINVHPDFEHADITIERHISGFDAGEHQIYYQFYNEQRKNEIHDELLDIFKNSSHYVMDDIQNIAETDAFYRPLIIKGHVGTLHTPLFEKANDKYIFKFGSIFKEYVDPNELNKKEQDFVFAHALTRSKEVIINFPSDVDVLNTAVIPVFDKLNDLENTLISSTFSVNNKQLRYKVRDEFKSHRFPIESKSEMLKIFEFHDQLSKVNLVIE